jgi:hypothetical protein
MLNKSRAGKVINIDIMLKNINEIFQQSVCNTLNREFEDYIFESVKNYALDKEIKLIIHIPKEVSDMDLIKHTIHKHFAYKEKEIGLQLKQQFYQWIINIIIGILFLVLCLILVEVLEVFSYINIIKILKESLLIIGWVALWEPVSFILFGWRSKKRDKLLCEKLSLVSISIVSYQFL